MTFTRNTWTSEISGCGRYTISLARIPSGYCYQAFVGREIIASEHMHGPCNSEIGKNARTILRKACATHAMRSQQQAAEA